MLIEFQKVSHVYPTGEQALKEINFQVSSTDPIAIIGQNGAGKTTIVKHLNGLLKATSGDVLIEGVSVSARTTSEWAKTVGYVFQNPDNQLFLDTVKKELEFGPKQIGMSKKEIAERVSMVSEFIGLEKSLTVHPFDLSATEKKFCTIGSVLMMNPKIIILDEPTCGQDTIGNTRLKKLIQEIKNQGILCITISHDMKFVVENFKRVIVMKQGEIIIDGPKEEVFKETEKLASSYVSAPPITRLSQKLGFKQLTFTADELIKQFEEE